MAWSLKFKGSKRLALERDFYWFNSYFEVPRIESALFILTCDKEILKKYAWIDELTRKVASVALGRFFGNISKNDVKSSGFQRSCNIYPVPSADP